MLLEGSGIKLNDSVNGSTRYSGGKDRSGWHVMNYKSATGTRIGKQEVIQRLSTRNVVFLCHDV